MASLGDHVEILSGFAFKSAQFSDTGDLPIVRIRDVKRGHSETFYTGEYSTDYLVRDGDLLVGMDGEFNAARWPGGQALLNQRVCKITTASPELDEQYLYYFLPRKLKEIEDRTPSVTVKHLSAKTIRQIQIPLPPLEEQKRVAAILDEADAIRRKRQQAIELTEQLLCSVFLDMFGGPVSIENDWAVAELGEFCSLRSGVTKGRKLDQSKAQWIPYMRVANVQDGFIDTSEMKEIQASPEEIEKYHLQPGDILLTEGGDPDKLGRGAVWDGNINPCIHQNHVFRVRTLSDDLRSTYLSALIGSSYGKRYFLRAAKQTTGIASINMTQLRQFPVIVPPRRLQEAYEAKLKLCQGALSRLQEHEAATDRLFNSLVQRAFRGELLAREAA